MDFAAVFRVMAQIGVCTLITAFAQWLMNVCNNKMTYPGGEGYPQRSF